LIRPVEAAAPASIHWCDYPEVEANRIDPLLERRMETIRRVAALGRRVREDHRIKVRQPLRKLTVVHRDGGVREDVLGSRALIADELNVKEVAVEADESAFASVSVKPNFKTLGKRCGPKLKEIGPALAAWGFDEVSRLEAGESIEVVGEAITIDDVLLQREQRETQGNAATATDGEYTVVLDTHLDAALEREGLARDAINLFNNLRKEEAFEVSDRVRIGWSCEDPDVEAALIEHAALIGKEILATEFQPRPARGNDGESSLGGAVLRYSIERAD
jgi:isoleucyl-tRNA synthetase